MFGGGKDKEVKSTEHKGREGDGTVLEEENVGEKKNSCWNFRKIRKGKKKGDYKMEKNDEEKEKDK